MIPYLTGNEAPNVARMNALFAALDTRLTALLGGRSFVVAHRNLGGGIGYPIFGKTFFFLSGAVTYAPSVPGFIPRSTTAADPITGVVTAVSGGRSYNHSQFTAAAAAGLPTAYDEENGVATVPALGGGHYDGLPGAPNVSLFEHSLEAHSLEHTPKDQTVPRRYYLREAGCPVPEKHYRLALAEILIEGPATLAWPAAWNKYSCLRFHNLQPRSCVVSFPGYELTLGPFECRTVRRDWNATTRTHGNYRTGSLRYFCTFEAGDPRFFTFFPSQPQNGAGSERSDVFTAASGMQGNNLSNPAVVYDWVRFLCDQQNWAFAHRNPHEVCDVGGRWKDQFAALDASGAVKADAVLGDLIHHRGDLVLKRLHKTQKDPRDSKVPLVVTERLTFRGHATLVADCAARQITVDLDPAGNLRLANADSTSFVDLISLASNLLKRRDYGGDAGSQIVPTAVEIGTGGGRYVLESEFFESTGAPGQDIHGVSVFQLRNSPSYRLTQRRTVSTPTSLEYWDETFTRRTFNGDALVRLDEVPLGAAATVVGLQAVPVSALLSLKYFGNPALASQSDAHVTYSGARLVLTPEGWVLLFTESVRGDLAPNNLVSRTWYANQWGNRYTFNPASGRWEQKHCIRFRKHGFGYGQLGRENALFLPPHHGRANVAGHVTETVAPLGGDFGLQKQQPRETGVRLLRQIGVAELETAINGGRFFGVGHRRNLDGLIQFDQFDAGDFRWYPTWRSLLISGNSDSPRTIGGARFLIALPLLADHYNGMAQAVNQLQTGRILDWRALRIVWGSRVQDFSTLLTWEDGIPGSTPTGWPAVNTQGGTQLAPAPVEAFCAVSGGHNPGWKEFFASRSVPLKGVTDFPDRFHELRETQRRREVWESVMSASVSGASIQVERLDVPPAGTPVWYYTVSGDVRYTLSFPQLRFVDSGPAGEVRVHGFGLSFLMAAGQSPYEGLEYVTIRDIQTMIEALGFRFLHGELFVPYRLDLAEQPSELVPTEFHQSSWVHTYSGPLFSDIVTGFFNPADEDFNSYNKEYVRTTIHVGREQNVGANLPVYRQSQQLVLRLAEPGEEVEWKWRVASLHPGVGQPVRPPECRRDDRRMEGHAKMNLSQQISLTTLPGGFNAQRARPLRLGLSQESLLRNYPWLAESPEAVTDLRGLQPWPPYGSRLTGGFAVRSSAEPKFYLEPLLPADQDSRRRIENWERMNEALNLWYAVQIIATNPVQQRFVICGIPVLGEVRDWWLQDFGRWMTVAAGVPASNPKAVPAPAPAAFACTNGLTVLKPAVEGGCQLLFDPAQLVTSF